LLTKLHIPSLSTQANGYFEVLVPASRNNANAPSGSAIMGGMWCLTANDPGSPGRLSAVPPLKDFRAITACFEALPGRIIPVDLALVSSAAPMALPNGDLVNVPCALPPGKPELFNVQGSQHQGPICSAYPCELEIRGRHFFNDATSPVIPAVTLAVPDEQTNVPYSRVTGPLPEYLIEVSDAMHNDTNGAYPYDSVRDLIDAAFSSHNWVVD
jgi:hypothetical protein